MNARKTILTISALFLSAFVLFSPQTSQAISCKCTISGNGVGGVAASYMGGNLTQCLLPNQNENCAQFEARKKSEIDFQGLDFDCDTYSDSACTITTRTDSGQIFSDLANDLNARKPLLEINIPGLNFSNISSSTDGTGTYVYIAWLPELISALYKFGIAIVSIVAVVVIIIQGVRVITSGGGEAKAEAYKRIMQSIIGLAIAWGSFAILYNINPALVQFNALKVKVIQPQDLPPDIGHEESEEDEGASTGDTSIIKEPISIKGKGIQGSAKINPDLAEDYKKIAAELYDRSANLPGGPWSIRGSGFRPLGQRGDGRCNEKNGGGCDNGSQVGKWERNCEGKAKCDVGVCDPFANTKATRYKDGVYYAAPNAIPNPLFCPHTSGKAVDITCSNDKYKNVAMGPLFAPCQRLLEEIMLEHDWCRITNELWHFEKPKLTGSCTVTKTNKANICIMNDPKTGIHNCNGCMGVFNWRDNSCKDL